ncbi:MULTISPECIES: asparaginase [Methylobacterium]|jgi:L-asparaginase|uniref:asparaginase n=1 Tax=Methylobacterium TaxID=407 RepID=UPI0008E159A6|nr:MULTISPECIES: asparaginase [Methylobacterium]MBZ6416902.1 asparaginase [Methylobacterium sp.]MBK3396255.1 asparaginase [Methylobacterium ajmalii]MBK3412763.1 asparaginase [Methylobacterium ajmalii]MBK3423258.1 asparaginase [Methylobacterium ajmalii]SFF84538.1 L-asparaginase [Methylobacterium sp. yr596]
MSTLPKVAFIGTGGTLSSVGRDSLDILDYTATGRRLEAEEILARVPETRAVAEVVPVRYRAVTSPGIGFSDWRTLVRLCEELAGAHPDLAGIVIGHGTATLEETAYALSLTLTVDLPVVLVGSQRPISALSSDAGLNLVAALRTAAAPESRGRGVLVVLNDEIQAAREVTKTSVTRMQTFRSPDFGVLGQVDGEHVRYYRRSERRHAPGTPFDIRTLDALPRVDISYAYADADGTAVRAFAAAGARGIVSAGLAPGMTPPAEAEALAEAAAAGIAIVQSTRAGSGVVPSTVRLASHGIVPADNLTAQKARILLALALTVTRDPGALAEIFATY